LPPKESIKPLPWYPARRSPSGPSVPPKPLPPQLQVSADASLLTQDQGKEKFTLQDIGEPFEESALPSQSIPEARREAPLVSNSSLGRPLVKRGYLSMRGKNFGGWYTRYFILDKPALRYYRSYDGVLSPGGYLGSIQIRGAQIGRQQNPGPDEENPVYRHALLILEPNQKGPSSPIRHVFFAETDRKRDEWVEALLQYVNYEDE
jgi:RalA-binding protein 1